MKKIIEITILIIFFFLLGGMFFPLKASSPPDPPGGHGLDGNQGSGGMAPIDGGLIIMLAAGAVYGLGKCMRRETGSRKYNRNK